MQERRAGSDLGGFRVAIGGRPALDHVGDEHLTALPADRVEQFIQQAAGGAHERPALPVFVEAGALANEDNFGVRVTLAGHSARAPSVERTARADVDLGSDLVQGRPSLVRRHAAAPPAGRLAAGDSQPRRLTSSAI